MGIIFYFQDVATWEVSWKIWINKWQVGQGAVVAMAWYLTWWNESLSGIQRPRYLQDQGFPAGPVLVSYLGALSLINLKTWDCSMGQDSEHSIFFWPLYCHGYISCTYNMYVTNIFSHIILFHLWSFLCPRCCLPTWLLWWAGLSIWPSLSTMPLSGHAKSLMKL